MTTRYIFVAVLCSLAAMPAVAVLTQFQTDLVAKATESQHVDDWKAVARSLGRSDDAWEIEDWTIVTKSIKHKKYGDVNVTTFSSPVLPIMKGKSGYVCRVMKFYL